MSPLLLPLFLVWFFGLVVLVFRRVFPLAWRLAALLIFIAFFFLMGDVLARQLDLWQSAPLAELLALLEALARVAMGFFLVAWPVTLVIIFYKADFAGAARLLRRMVWLTAIYLFLFLFYALFYTDWQRLWLELKTG